MSSGSARGERAQPEAPVVGTLLSVNVGMPKDVPWQDLEYSPDPVEPRADASALICCSEPRGDVVLDP